MFRLGDDGQLVDLRLPAEFAVDLYRICDAQRCVVWAAMDDEVLVKLEGENHSLPAGLRAVRRLSGEADEISPRMLLVQGTEACEQVSAELESKWTGRARFVESFSSRGKRILTITADGADKGSALTACCADLAIQPSDVVAFGDAENDVAMFALAGGSFAMGQAKDAVKSAATGVTASNNDDGVAVAIEALLEYGDDAFRRQLS